MQSWFSCRVFALSHAEVTYRSGIARTQQRLEQLWRGSGPAQCEYIRTLVRSLSAKSSSTTKMPWAATSLIGWSPWQTLGFGTDDNNVTSSWQPYVTIGINKGCARRAADCNIHWNAKSNGSRVTTITTIQDQTPIPQLKGFGSLTRRRPKAHSFA
ncbi:hypothetical protein LA080_015794 [Diaporthe eres]|nr:hypothetical protein LA080_015794 [Diaporthe eres]